MKYFITGNPGSGKTTTGKLLEGMGYKFIDIDNEPGLANWFNKETGNVTPPNPNADALWYNQHDWNWDREKLQNLLDKEETVFISGVTSNQADDLDLFDKVFFLKADEEELRKRMIERRKGAKDEEIDHVFEWYQSFEKEMLKRGAVPIDAGQSSSKVVEDIIKLI